jgi:signal transduction histidine kinase
LGKMTFRFKGGKMSSQGIVRVLAVDDEQAVLESYRTILTSNSHADGEMNEIASILFGDGKVKPLSNRPEIQLVTCSQGDKALEAVDQSLKDGNPFALAFIDFRMPPGPDGGWTAEHIRAIDPNIQIMIVTGYSDVDPAELAGRIEPADKLLYVQKPFHPKEIWQYVTALGAKWYAEMELVKANAFLEAYNQQISKARDIAEQANKAKADFMNAVSKNIRTPVNSIIGLADVLAAEEIGEEIKELVTTMQENGQTIARLITELADFANLESGNLAIQVQQCSLGRVLSSVHLEFSPAAEAKGVALELSVRGQVDETVRTDPMRVSQCLTHLVRNAIKMTDHGRIELSVFREEVDGRDSIRFELRDTSIGMTQSQQEALFTRPNTMINTGNGMVNTEYSMVITKKLAALLGGDISVASIQGRGSIYVLLIPAQLDHHEPGVRVPALAAV